jgi:ElaB/YqjD/DUF883 family membrane-anchored ribosome-binding protein
MTGAPDKARRLLLEEQAAQARAALRTELLTLADQLEPGSIARTIAARAGDAIRAELGVALDDAGRWARANALLLAGGAAAMGAIAALGFGVTRWSIRRDEARHFKEDVMTDPETDMARRWDRVREGAEDLGQKASETYYHARSRAADLSLRARDRAQDAAEQAGEAASRAAEWTKRQQQDNPMTSVIVGFAFGAILAALLPRGGRRA